MSKRIAPNKQVEAAFNMGRLEARLSFEDSTLKASDFTEYLKNCETANVLADIKVLKYIVDSHTIFTDHRLKKIYNKYKSKYWKK